MSLRRTLDTMALTVGRASSVPLSASCMVNRAEMLSLIERARGELPAELDEATQLLVAHQEVLDTAEREGEQLLENARSQAEAMIEDTVIVANAQARADAILHAARAEATRLLRSADQYCDRRLALFQSDLEACLGQVSNGRVRLQERSELDTFAQESGLADAADAVDDAYRASRELDDQSDELGPDAEIDGYDLTEIPVQVQDEDPVAEPAEPAALSSRKDLNDLNQQAGLRPQVIDLRGEAEPAGLGRSGSLQ